MSAFAYYSPLWIGALLCAGVLAADYDRLPESYRVLILLLVCPLAGAACQLVMIGCQGAFAQVLPVPVGKSIHGRGAVVAGWLVLLSIASAGAGPLIGFDQWNAGALGALAVGGAAGACALGAYIWCLPAAVRDFHRA